MEEQCCANKNDDDDDDGKEREWRTKYKDVNVAPIRLNIYEHYNSFQSSVKMKGRGIYNLHLLLFFLVLCLSTVKSQMLPIKDVAAAAWGTYHDITPDCWSINSEQMNALLAPLCWNVSMSLSYKHGKHRSTSCQISCR